MPRKYLKKAALTSRSGAEDVRDTVLSMLEDIERRGDVGAMEYAEKFDRYEGNIRLTPADIKLASETVPDQLKRDSTTVAGSG